MDNCGKPASPPMADRIAFNRAINPMNAISAAMTFSMTFRPIEAPVAMASTKLPGLALSTVSFRSARLGTSNGLPVSGTRILAMRRPPGAAMKAAVSSRSMRTPRAA